MSTNKELTTDSSSEEMKKCFSLLEEGEKIIRTDQKDAVLVLGNTGSGKSTVVQFLAGNNAELHAEEISPGEFIIFDTKDRISNSTLVSKTIFPELTIDKECNIGIFDAPGFVDTRRGVAFDIVGTYFIRKVINSIERIKFILTVNYTSVRTGIDRGDFLGLIRHVLSLVKNVDEYYDSFAIVVTKVDNTYIKNTQTRSPELVSDDTVRQAVAKFLLSFRENVSQISNEIFSAKAIKLVDALLSKNGTSYEKIGIFRRPDEAGPLSKSTLLQEGKRFMKKMITDSIKYSPVHPNDFGYSISDRSKNEVKDLIDEINKIIQTHTLEVCAEMEAMIDNKHQQVKDIHEFEKFLENVQKKINLFKDTILYETNLKDFIRKLHDLIVDLRVNISKKSLSEILNQSRFLDFLELVSERKVEGSSSKWKEGFRQITSYLKEMREWYSFLNQFHNRLSSYEIQKFRSNYTFLYENTISSLADEKLEQFLSQQHFNMTTSLKTMKLDSTQILTLNNLIRSALNTSTSVEYDKDLKGHIITGDFLMLSKIDKYFTNNDEVICIFASNKIFIDKNITMAQMNTNLNNLAIIAPTLEVIGTENIILDGKDGDRIPPPFQNGMDGSPGQPGNQGANFIGVAENWVNSENLMISANGGQGGPGQDGAHGKRGEDGLSPIKYYNDGTCELLSLDMFDRAHNTGYFWVYNIVCVIGRSGSSGGDGGDGGIGGSGAPAGNITLFALDGHKPLSLISKKNGSNGPVGLGGKGGYGGKAGKSINSDRLLYWWLDSSCEKTVNFARKYSDCSETDYLRNGPSGKDGYSGRTTYPIQSPKLQKPAPNGIILMKFKEFMRHPLILDNINQNEKYRFLKSLNQNSVLTKTYTIKDLISEFISLENEYTSPDFDWLAAYEQLLKLAESQTTSNPEHKQVLLTLQKAIISKLCLLKVKPEKILITQVPRYLDSEQTSLNQFLKKDENLLILNENYKKLKKELLKTLKEIQQRAQPIANKMATMIDVVWNHTNNFADKLVTDKNQEENQQQLQKNLILLKVLQGIQETAQFLDGMSKFGEEIISVTRSANKYVIQNGSYKSAVSKLQEILLHIFPSNKYPQLKQILVDATHQKIPNDIKMLLKRFAEIAETKSLDEKLEMRKICRDLLQKLSDLKGESPQMVLIEVALHVKNATISAIGSETTKRAEILGATLHNSTAYDHIHFYVEKLDSVVDQVLSTTSTHLVDEIVDTSRTSKEYFSDIKLLLQQLAKSAKLPEDLYSIFQQLLADVNIISSTYDFISYFQEYERLLTMKKEVPQKIWDYDLKNITDFLGIITESNLVLGQYRVSLKNMEQIVFPFAALYEDEFSVHSGTNVKNITTLVMEKLQSMKSSVEKQGIYLDSDHAKLVFEGEFTNRENGLGAFYTWKNENHKKAIEDLLAGNAVTLKSDIVNGVPQDAVKFSSIRIKFTCKNEVMQSELDKVLNNLQVSMVHGEDSYYRCGHEFYRFTFDRQTHSYRIKENGEPAVRNLSSDDIKNGVYVLSPYTQWSIQLKDGNFEKLVRYKDYVDIELEGQGKWIKADQVCGKNLQKYYTIDDTISEANAVEDNFIDLSKVLLKNELVEDSTLPQLHRVARSLDQSEFKYDFSNPTMPLLENTLHQQIEMHGQQKEVSFCAMAQSSLNNCLLLLDLLVRRFTNVKPKHYDHCSTSYLNGKICSVEIVRDFDMLVESLCDYPHQYDIDPVPLMELISKDIANENGRNIAEILLKSVQSNGSSVPDEFYNQLRSKMTRGQMKHGFLKNDL